MISDLITQQDDIKVIEIKDYIKNPKSNGYRSYHMIVEIPVFFAKGKTPMRVELQIRTNGMDFWATLEHQLRYKKGIEEMQIMEKHSRFTPFFVFALPSKVSCFIYIPPSYLLSFLPKFRGTYQFCLLFSAFHYLLQ